MATHNTSGAVSIRILTLALRKTYHLEVKLAFNQMATQFDDELRDKDEPNHMRVEFFDEGGRLANNIQVML
jgi:hypothetical protein